VTYREDHVGGGEGGLGDGGDAHPILGGKLLEDQIPREPVRLPKIIVIIIIIITATTKLTISPGAW
jgi:hypothetical protein